MSSMQRGKGPGNQTRGMIVKHKPKDAKKTIKRLLKFIGQFPGWLALLIIGAIVMASTSIYTNLGINDIIKNLGEFDLKLGKFTTEPDFKGFLIGLLTLGICYGLNSLFSYLASLGGANLSTRVVKKLREQLFAKIVKLPIRYVDTHPHGDIMSKVINDTDAIAMALSESLSSLISGIITIVGCFLVMLFYSPLLALCSIGILILTVLATSLISKFMTPLYRRQQDVLGELNSQAEEMISGNKTVMAYNRQDKAKVLFNAKSDEMTKLGIKAQIIGGSMGPVMNCIGNIGYFLISFVGALLIIKGTGKSLLGNPLDIATVIMFLHTVKQFTRPINEIAQQWASVVSATAGAERIFELLDEQEEDFTGKVPFDGSSIKGIIDFNHINFEYRPNHLILKDFNVDVRSGHKIALVGATGSGKTTIVNLLLRFYDVTTGKITIDGVNINDISKKDLRDCISIVLQDPVLFNDTIENNIRYGKADATDEEIDAALEFANCSSFVNKLPQGKKTILTEGANNISQGQRQLLTIARAVISDPKILILDEATSSVDTRTEKNIQDAMVRLMKNRTSIIIAHRLSTIQDAHLIVVIDDGHVVEMGNHNELIALDGVYNKLYQAQFIGRQI